MKQIILFAPIICSIVLMWIDLSKNGKFKKWVFVLALIVASVIVIMQGLSEDNLLLAVDFGMLALLLSLCFSDYKEGIMKKLAEITYMVVVPIYAIVWFIIAPLLVLFSGLALFSRADGSISIIGLVVFVAICGICMVWLKSIFTWLVKWFRGY